MAVIEPELIPEPEVVEAELVPARQEDEQAADWKMVVGLSALLAMICSVDRAAMSVALGPMASRFQTLCSLLLAPVSSTRNVGVVLT